MRLHNRTLGSLLIATSSLGAFAQKIDIGYDKGVDFLKFKTYTWGEPSMPSSRPLLYATIVDSIDYQLESKGLKRVDKDGDLILLPAGGMEFGLNVAASTPIISSYSGLPPAMDATMWTGTSFGANLMAPYVPQGTLALTFVDRSANKVIWSGTLKEKLDLEKKRKSLEKIDKGIAKLLRDFPPKAK